MSVTKTDYGYKSEKDVNAGVQELCILLSNPKNLSTTHYQTLEKDDKHLKYTDSMSSNMYSIELLEAAPRGPIVYKFFWQMLNMLVKTSRMEIFIEPKDDIKTRILIKCTRLDLQFSEQMQATLHYMAPDTLDSMTSVMQELTTFQVMIDLAIQANLPYIRDAIIVKGDYVAAKVEIKDSVVQRSDIHVGGKPPSDVHIRTEGNYIPTRTTIVDSVVTRSDVGQGSEIKDSVVIGKKGDEKVDGAARCLNDPNLETYRRALEKAVADGQIVESEERMLRTLRASLKVTMEQHEKLLEEIKLSSDKNYQTYKQCMADAMIDGQVDPDEQAMLQTLRESLGITEAMHAKAFEELRKQRLC